MFSGRPQTTVVRSGRRASAPFPKFVIRRSTLCHELRKQRGTSKTMILVPLFDLKFLIEFAATGVGTSNRRHYLARYAKKRHNAASVHPGHAMRKLIQAAAILVLFMEIANAQYTNQSGGHTRST